MKEQDKNSEEDLSEVEIASLLKRVQSNDCKHDQRTQEKNGRPEQEVRIFKKRVRPLKNNKTEVRNTITEMKNTLKGNYCRLNDTEE